jgi:hypothetical protein
VGLPAHDPLDRLDAAHHRQVEVHEDDGRRSRVDERDRLLAVAGLARRR